MSIIMLPGNSRSISSPQLSIIGSWEGGVKNWSSPIPISGSFRWAGNELGRGGVVSVLLSVVVSLKGNATHSPVNGWQFGLLELVTVSKLPFQSYSGFHPGAFAADCPAELILAKA